MGMSNTPNERFLAAGIELPKVAAPVANYVPVLISKGHAFVAGQITVLNGELKYVGQLGKGMDVETGKRARAAIGVSQLPMGAAVEVDAIFEVSGDRWRFGRCQGIESCLGTNLMWNRAFHSRLIAA
jgi:enamine deaminase RidA (YjgF/YER057c/UK114 family)